MCFVALLYFSSTNSYLILFYKLPKPTLSSSFTMAKPVKQLRELLQEKQEPFILELYLLEKGYLTKSFNPATAFSCCRGNSRKSQILKRTKMGIPRCSNLLRAGYNQVVSLNQRLKIKSSNSRDGDVHFAENKDRNNQETVPELDRFSSASSSTVFDSCTLSDAEDTSTSQETEHISIKVKEVVTDRKLQWQFLEESRVLQEVASHRDTPLHNHEAKNLSRIKETNGSNTCTIFHNKVTEDSILSASLLKILVQSATDKPTFPGVPQIQELVQSNNSSRYLKSKRVLQQTKQLLFDCVREIIETQSRKEKHKQQRQYLASDEFGQLIGEKIRCWGKQHGEESNLDQLLEFDFRDSAQEWIGYELQRRKIGYEIGDAIMEELRNEIVMDMI